MHYSENPGDVRVDFFKQSGKWYTTDKVVWTGKWKGRPEEGGQLIHAAFAQSIKDHCRTGLESEHFYSGMIAVCLAPYHEHAFPLMMNVDDIFAGKYD